MGKLMNQQEAIQVAKEQNSIIVKLSKNECWRKVVIKGGPWVLHTHWIDGKSAVCNETPACPHCKKGNVAAPAFAYQVYDYDCGVFKPRILELSKRAFLSVSDTLANSSPDSIFKILRTGENYDIKYTITVEGKLTQEQQMELNSLEIPSFEDVYKPSNGTGGAK